MRSMGLMGGWSEKWLARLAALSGITVLASLCAQPALADGEARSIYNMPPGVTAISREVYGLHMGIFYVCCVIGLLVFGVMFYSVFAHRKSRGHKPADFHESTTVEIIWTVLPFVILIACAVPAAGTLIKMEDTRNADLTIKVTGYQWKWEYEYLDQGVKFFSTLAPDSNHARQLDESSGGLARITKGIQESFSAEVRQKLAKVDNGNYLLEVDRPLVLPVGKKIRFLITANDVIHAWWVPDLAIKKDAIPGFVNEIWTRIDQPGTLRGVCAELCGRDHGFMPIVVKAVPESEFKTWLAKEKGPEGQQLASAAPTTASDATAAASSTPVPAPTEVAAAAPPPAAGGKLSKDDLMKQGEKAYATNCAACHQPTGQGMAPTFPSLVGSKVVKGPIADHIKQVLNGKNVMTPFKHLSDADIAAIVTYERNSFGNNVGDMAQPDQVKALR